MKMNISSLYFILFMFGYSFGLTDDEALLIKLAKYFFECAKDTSVDTSDLIKLHQLEVPTKPEVKCLIACAYRKYGTLRDDGMFDAAASMKLIEEVGEGDEKRLENAKKLYGICNKVNEEKVSDGAKGCDRATLMFDCLKTHAPKFGFKTQLEVSKISEFLKL